jgi:glycosyltransferase involved in cell wall biosynthesis
MRAVQVNCARDPLRRTGKDLLDAWPTLLSVASAVRSAGAEVSVIQSANEDAECERDGVPFRFVAEPWFGGKSAGGYAPLRIARAVKALRPQVVHVNGLGFPFHTRAICSLGVPVLIQDHGDNPCSRLGALRRWGLAKVSGFAFTSSEQALPFSRNKSIRPGAPVFAIPESSTHFREGDVEHARMVTGVHGNPAVLWIGHLNMNKDPMTILEVFSRALRRLPRAHLWVCYQDASLLGHVQARLAADSLLSSHVHLLGSVSHDRVELLCRAADFFMLGSRRESCGYALLEALACGATPIVSDIPAFRAITARGAVGVLCEPGDIDAFAAALISLSDRPIGGLRVKAISHFKSELSFPVLGKKLLAAYETLVGLLAGSGRKTP